MTGISVHEHELRVRKNAGKRVDGENMFGRFQDPTPRWLGSPLKVTKKPRKELVAFVKAGCVEPGAIGWGAIDVIVARTAEHLAGNLDAFLRRVRLDRMQVSDPWREPVEDTELQRNLPAPCAKLSGAMLRTRVDRLPYARSAIEGILRKQAVQERRAAAREAGDEDRRPKRPRQDRGIFALRVRENQKRREHPLEVPTRREAPERRQRRLLTEAGREGAKRLDEARVGERLGVETRALCRVGDQRLWREPRFVAGKKRAGKPVHSPGYDGATQAPISDNFWRSKQSPRPFSLRARS